MPTLTAVRQRMLALEPRILGRVLTPASITTLTVVVSELATGTVGSTRYGGYWLLRPTAASQPADRLRIVTETGFASASGTLTHAGTNYADTTVGTEQVELHAFEPRLLDIAINEAVRQCRRSDTLHFQVRPDGRYDLAAYDWLDEPSLIVRLGQRAIQTLTPNRHFERWGTIHTDGTLRPDNWTLGGAGGTFARTTTARRGPYALSALRAGTDLTVAFTLPVRYSDAGDDDLRGDILTAGLVARSTEASSVRVRVTSEDGSGNVLSTTNSDYHTGADAWEEVEAVHTVDAAAERVTLTARVEVNETALIDELYLAFTNGLTDDLRRDSAPTEWLQRPYMLQQNPLMWSGPRGRGTQLVMESKRAYPTFDATRLAAGTADSDSTDCPLDLVAHKALAVFFAGRATENARMAELANQYARKADDLQAQHLYVEPEQQPGAKLVSGRFYGIRQGVR